jgi:hypothetical protein
MGPLVLPNHLDKARRRRAPRFEVAIVDDEVHPRADVVQPPAQKGGERLGVLEGIHGQVFEVDEYEVIVRAVIDAFVERQR